MNSAIVGYYIKKLTGYLAVKTEMVNHRAVIKEVASGVDRSWIYYSILILAGLIALLGLLTNSVAVVIGAMLISPLMGPIISSGLAFTIGDLSLARRAFKTIAVSVVLTIVVCAVVSFVSPLKDPTQEILARVRPNIYDLFIATLSGIAGAIALCTKRNYLITATGVAVATAVIPPLSVTGYGLGTGQLMLAMGGFLLFFTNFVAIVLTSDLVFFILGFRTSHLETIQYSPRTRFLIIAGLLTLISIPLVYTLVADLTRVKEKKRIETVLKRHLNKEQTSRMTGYDYRPEGTKVQIRASVNTVKLIDRQSELKMEKALTDALNRPVDVHLEQVIVASERALQLSQEAELGSSKLLRGETTAQIKDKVEQLALKMRHELSETLAPFPVTDTRLTIASGPETLQVSMALKRDFPMGDDETLLLSRLLERSIGVPVVLTVKTFPLFPLLTFDHDGALTPASLAGLSPVKNLPGGVGTFRFILESSFGKHDKRLEVVRQHLIREFGVPDQAIRISSRRTPTGSPGVTLRVVRP